MEQEETLSEYCTQVLMKLGRRIACHRQAAGITLEELSQRSGVDAAVIRTLESPDRAEDIMLDDLFAIAEALGVQITKLFAGIA